MSLSPLSLTYMRIIRLLLISVGAWPTNNESSLYQRTRLIVLSFVIFQAILAAVGMNIFLYTNFSKLSLFELVDKIVIMFFGLLTVYRVCLPVMKRYFLVNTFFIEKFHLIHFRDKTHYFNSIYQRMNHISYYYTAFICFIMFSGMMFFNLVPIYNNYKNGVFSKRGQKENITLEFSLYYMLPGFNPEDHFIFTTITNIYMSFVCGVTVCINDLFLTLDVLQIIGHIKALSYNLNQFPAPQVQTYTEKIAHRNYIFVTKVYDVDSNKLIHSKIVECVNHHRFIVSFAAMISSFHGPILGLNYLFQMVSCCLLLLECSQPGTGAVVRYGPLTSIIFFQLVQLSVTFEIIGTESEKLKDAVYALPWEFMDIPNQRSVYILLQRIQNNIKITAMGMATVGVQAMLGVLKTTISYFAFLRSINN